MRIRDLTRPIFEFVYDKAVVPGWASQEPVVVHKNPAPGELQKIAGEYSTTRAFLVKDGMLAWGLVIHAPVAESLGLNKYVIPIVLYVDGSYADAMVTDFSKRTVWHENPATADAIRGNPYMKKTFRGGVSVSYYNENVVGDWEEL